MRIAIGADHNGVALKEAIKNLLARAGHEIRDVGSLGTDPVDFPDIARQVTSAVTGKEASQGILICGNGIGMTMAANKVAGIRAALCHNVLSGRQAREHNDANVLCLGGLMLEAALATEVVQAYLSAEFKGTTPEGERYARRVGKMADMDQRQGDA